MSKIDFTITGAGGLSIVDDGGSKRCRLSYSKLMLWNGNPALGDCECVVEVQNSAANSNSGGGVILRSNSTAQTCYRLLIYGGGTGKAYYIQKAINGQYATLGTFISTRTWNDYTKIRFRVDGFQLSVEEYINGNWVMAFMVEDTSHAIISGSVGLFGESTNSGYSISFDNMEINTKV
jgi:hypothetical protein